MGPVQGFVAQARRTRDIWAGSFLLSWLTGQAIQTVRDNCGEIIFPQFNMDDPLIEAIECVADGKQPQESPQIASLPNRFMAKIDSSFNPELCYEAVHNEWQRIADTVYTKYIAPIEHLGNDTKEIWDRQVHGFWDIVWAEDPSGTDRRVLDRRKMWRNHIPTIEPGDKCSLMANFQELSGHLRSCHRNQHRTQQDKFWQAVRGQTGYNIRENERLCAIAFIKRMFPLLAPRIIGSSVDTSYPSTSSLAIAHWLEEVTTNSPELCRKFVNLAQELGKNTESKIKVTKRLEKSLPPELRSILSIQSECF